MRLLRFLLILLAVSAVGGGFGAVVGGLFGYSLPRGFQVSGTVEPGIPAAGGSAEVRKPAAAGTVGVQVSPGDDASPAAKGAAFGASVGMALGAFLGFLLAILDQFFLQVAEWYSRRKAAAAP